MDVRELRPGLWRWTAPHPDWTPEQGGPEGWEQEVASYAVVAPDALVLFDPLAPPDGTPDAERFWRRLDEDVAARGAPDVLLTVFWHARSSQQLLERYPGTRVWAHEGAAEWVGERVRYTDIFRIGDALPGGAEPLDALRVQEVLFWLPAYGALVTGDTFLGAEGGGVRRCPDSWLENRTDPEEFRRSLGYLLALPIELLLPTHGDVVAEDAHGALARALEQPA